VAGFRLLSAVRKTQIIFSEVHLLIPVRSGVKGLLSSSGYRRGWGLIFIAITPSGFVLIAWLLRFSPQCLKLIPGL
jgi:hypothetical protein